MFDKVNRALGLFMGHFGLLAPLVLLVAVPMNCLLNYVAFYVLDPDDVGGVMRASMFLEAIFGPIHIGAVTYVLWQVQLGRPVRYLEAVEQGFVIWGRLFAARLVAGLLIGLGFLLLIVPGIILALNYAFLDCTVVIEKAGAAEARHRSTDLTRGVRGSLLCVCCLFYFLFLFLGAVVYVPVGIVQGLSDVPDAIWLGVEVVIDSGLDVAFTILQVIVFVYYWDQRRLREPLPAEPLLASEPWAASEALEGRREDGNPYRPPQA